MKVLVKPFLSLLKWKSRNLPRNLEVKIAESHDEFEQIHKFNYRIFVEEVAQHPSSESQSLVDKYNRENRYIIVKIKQEVVGMLCLRTSEDLDYSIVSKMTDPDKLIPYLANAVEIRLLAIKKPYRKLGIYWKLVEVCSNEIETGGYDHILISALEHRVSQYKSLGFRELDKPKTIDGTTFIPMYADKEEHMSFKRKWGL